MSGGLAYVYDERGDFTEKRCNTQSVDLEPLVDVQDVETVRDLVARHHELTGSRRAQWILDNWQESMSRFIKVFPHEFKRVLGLGRSQSAYIPLAALERVEVGEPEHRQVVNG